MTTIDVRADSVPSTYRVTLRDQAGTTEHRVTLKPADFSRLARNGEDEAAFLRRCFVFLLERESKESILASFDVMVIARYFPEFERSIR
jgi:hypothetical protein